MPAFCLSSLCTQNPNFVTLGPGNIFSPAAPTPTTLAARILILRLQQKALKISRLTNFRGLFSHPGGTRKAFANINGISFDIFKDQRIQENMQAGWAFEIRAPKYLLFQVKEEKKKKTKTILKEAQEVRFPDNSQKKK